MSIGSLRAVTVLRLLLATALSTSLTSCTWLEKQASAQDRPSAAPGTAGAAVSCYQRARSGGNLGEGNAFLLCRGAQSTGPAECFEQADDDTMLAQREIFDLCRCARSTAPVQCYERARQDTFLAESRLIALCSPVITLGLSQNCNPTCGVRAVP